MLFEDLIKAYVALLDEYLSARQRLIWESSTGIFEDSLDLAAKVRELLDCNVSIKYMPTKEEMPNYHGLLAYLAGVAMGDESF